MNEIIKADIIRSGDSEIINIVANKVTIDREPDSYTDTTLTTKRYVDSTLSGSLATNLTVTNYINNGAFLNNVSGWVNIVYSTLTRSADTNYISGYKGTIDNRTANIDQIRSNTFIANATTMRLTYKYKRNTDSAMSFLIVRVSNQSQVYNAPLNNTSLTSIDTEVTGLVVGASYYIELYSYGKTLTEIGNIFLTDQLQPKTPKNSIQVNSNQLQLVGDSATPGNNKYYGTNASGTKGFYDLPSGGSSFIPYIAPTNLIRNGFFYDNITDWTLTGEAFNVTGGVTFSGRYISLANGLAYVDFGTVFSETCNVKIWMGKQLSSSTGKIEVREVGGSVLYSENISGFSDYFIKTFTFTPTTSSLRFTIVNTDMDGGLSLYGIQITQ